MHLDTLRHEIFHKLHCYELIAEHFLELEQPIYLVGGALRSTFLHEPIKDFDLVLDVPETVYRDILAGIPSEFQVRPIGLRCHRISAGDYVPIDVWRLQDTRFISEGVLPAEPDSLYKVPLIDWDAIVLDLQSGEFLSELGATRRWQQALTSRTIGAQHYVKQPCSVYYATKILALRQKYGAEISNGLLALMREKSDLYWQSVVRSLRYSYRYSTDDAMTVVNRVQLEIRNLGVKDET
jgi:hypothetical protein